MNSRCSRCALFTSATVGATIAASGAISPGWFMPISTTPARCQRVSSWRRRSSVSGTPMALLRLPSRREGAPVDPGAQDRRDHLRHRRLAVAAGDGDQRQIEAPPPRRGQRAERPQRVGDLQAGQAGLGQPAFGERRRRAGCACLEQEFVGIEALAAQGDEQVAGAQTARVGVHAADRDRTVADELRPGQRRREQRVRLGERHHRRHAARASSSV